MEENNLTPPSETVDETSGPPARPSVLLWSVLVAVAFVFGLLTGFLLWERPLTARATAAEQKLAAVQETAAANGNAPSGENQVEIPEQVQRHDVPIDDDAVLGKDTAEITIIEFSDYECPFCQRWHQEVFPQIQEAYGDKVRLVYRDFPLYGLHPNAESAAEAANCAGEQDKYYDYHNLLLSGQKDFGTETYNTYAQSLKLNMDDFKQCMTEHRYQAEVKADYEYAAQLGVRGTPAFFINGLYVNGAQPFEVFQQIIDLELAGKIPK